MKKVRKMDLGHNFNRGPNADAELVQKYMRIHEREIAGVNGVRRASDAPVFAAV